MAAKPKSSSRISIAFRILFLFLPIATVSIIMAIFRALTHGVYLPTAVRNGIIRSFLTNLRPRQLQYLLPSGPEVFNAWIAKRQAATHIALGYGSDILEDGETRIFWVGNPNPSSAVILFIHGGGYVLPLSRGHLEWAEFFCEATSPADEKVSVALLDYSLCPEKTYPIQMRQAALAIKHLISMGYSPSKIVIGGDSAGGHLALSVISYLMHRYADNEVSGKGLSVPLSGCFLVSPLLSLELNTLSYKENRHADLLSIPIIRDWGADLFRGSRFQMEKQMGQGWGLALAGGKDWWGHLGEVVKRVYLVGGSEELFRDDIIEFGERLKDVPGVDVSIYINTGEPHDCTFMDFETGAPPSQSTIRLGRWVAESLQLSGLEHS